MVGKREVRRKRRSQKESHNSEVEMQIQSEMERNQWGNLTRSAASGSEEKEVGEEVEVIEDSVD